MEKKHLFFGLLILIVGVFVGRFSSVLNKESSLVNQAASSISSQEKDYTQADENLFIRKTSNGNREYAYACTGSDGSAGVTWVSSSIEPTGNASYTLYGITYNCVLMYI